MSTVFRSVRLVPPAKKQLADLMATIALGEPPLARDESRSPLVVAGEMVTTLHRGTAKVLGHLATAGFLWWLAGVLLVFAPPSGVERKATRPPAKFRGRSLILLCERGYTLPYDSY